MKTLLTVLITTIVTILLYQFIMTLYFWYHDTEWNTEVEIYRSVTSRACGVFLILFYIVNNWIIWLTRIRKKEVILEKKGDDGHFYYHCPSDYYSQHEENIMRKYIPVCFAVPTNIIHKSGNYMQSFNEDEIKEIEK